MLSKDACSTEYVGLYQELTHGVQLGAMHSLQTWMHPPGICKMSKTNMLIIPLKKSATTYFIHVSPLLSIYVCARGSMHCYRAHCVNKVLILCVLTKALFLRLCIHNIPTVYAHKRMCVYAPELQASASTMFMVWLLDWSVATNSEFEFGNTRKESDRVSL
jgi:hypothetical protein